MNVRLILASAILVTASLGGNASRAEAPRGTGAGSCQARAGLTPICNVPAPEDIEPTPDGKALFVSEVGISLDQQGGLVFKPGHLSIIDIATGQRRVLFPSSVADNGQPGWGDPACKPAGPAFSPGGLHLSKRTDGAWQLLAVNYAPHPSVEMFEVVGTPAHAELRWRGCVGFTDAVMLNDVAALPSGGFVTTVSKFGNETLIGALTKSEQGLGTGFVLRWRPDAGTDILPGSIMPFANGIQVSADGKSVFVASTHSKGEVRKIDIATGGLLGTVSIARPDNLAWNSDGKLIVGTGAAVGAACQGRDDCPFRYDIIAIDPTTMTSTTVRSLESVKMVDAVSVAAEAGSSYFLGSATGDRILRISRKQ